MNDLRFPIGKFQRPVAPPDADERSALLDQIAAAPSALRAAIDGLDEEQLATRYRDGGWTVKQVVHHLPDSHLNAYCRFKLALTEEAPAIRPYDEGKWAELSDSATTAPDVSLRLLEALHERWVNLLRAMAPGDFARTLLHPVNGEMTLDAMVALYAWHGRHHVAHITSLRERNGW